MDLYDNELSTKKL